MPYIVQGEPDQGIKTDFREKYDYTYPNGLDLRPGEDFHNKLVGKIKTRATESRNEMSKRFDSWNEIDRVLTTYIPLKDKEKATKKKDTTKPVSIVFPYTYSMLEALLTYLSMAFFQDPMFRYEGVSSEDVKGGMLLEQVIRLHCIKTYVALNVHTILRNSLAYGIGPGAPSWQIMHGKVPIKSTVSYEKGPVTESVNWIDSVIFEGNRLDPIDPYMYLPDPSVSSANVQDGEFVGWIVRDNLMNMLVEEQNNKETIFNVKYLKHMRNKTSSLSTDESNRNIKYGGQDSRATTPASTNHVDTIFMYVNLIPKDWELGASEFPEKWLFGLSCDSVITSASKIEHAHGQYPVGVASPEYDGFSPTPIARLEILHGLQHTLDWLFNSHIANVKKAINDMFIVDPYLVNIKDLEDPEPGKLIRLRRPAWGRGVDKVVQQLQVNDITRANITDSVYITQWMDRIAGADQSMGGTLRQGGPERLTKGEFQGTRQGGIARLQRMAMIIGMQFMQPLANMFAVHTQQYMKKETYVRTIGRYQEELENIFGKNARIPVTPFELSVNYDLIAHDGSIPGGNFSEIWVELWKIIAQDPGLRQQYDHYRMFEYIAGELGAKNMGDFRKSTGGAPIQPEVMADEKVLSEVQKGNMVSMGT